MSTKTISISEEAYNLLKNAKEEHESFTDAILKVARKDPLSGLVGILAPKDAEEIRRNVRNLRKRADKEVIEAARRFE